MKITWLGHSAFRIETGASVILIDPFLKGNPSFEAANLSWDEAIAGTTHIGLTHGHDDHIGDTVEICKATGATLFATFELASYLADKGVEACEPMNTGGTVAASEFDLTLTNAVHSSSSNGVYLGNPCGIVIKPHKGPTLYHMGDTDIFADMSLIEKLHKPVIGIVPIGDRFTMGATSAALACKTYFNFKTVLPCHYGTFKIIDQSADKFQALMARPSEGSKKSSQNVVVPKVGGSIDV